MRVPPFIYQPLRGLIALRFCFALLIVGGVFAGVPSGLAQEAESHRETLERVGAAIDGADEAELLLLREEIRNLRLVIDEEISPIRSRADEIEADLDSLGPVPEDGITEAREIRDLRDRLRGELDPLDAMMSQADLNLIEANRLLTDISNRRRDAFYERVLVRDKPPFTVSAASAVVEALKQDWGVIQDRYKGWQSSFETAAEFRTVLLFLALSAFVAFLLLWPIPRWADRTLLARYKALEPTPTRRLTLAAFRVISRALPALIAATIIYQVAAANGIVTDETSILVGSILLAMGTIFVVEDVATAVLAPKAPEWRLVCVQSKRAVLVRLFLVLTVMVFSANAVLTRSSQWLGSPRELVTSLSAWLMVAGAVLMFLLVRPQLWKLSDERPITLSPEVRTFWRWARNLIGVLALISVFAVLVGHVALGRFVLTRIYYLSFLFAGAWLIRALLYELIEKLIINLAAGDGADHQAQPGKRKDDQQLFLFWLQLMIDLTVFAVTLPLAFLIIGVKWTDMRNWVTDLIIGFEIGGVTISLANIFTAFIAVSVIMVLTRFIQRTADKRIFAQARMDSGLRNTFRTLIGYVGLILGVMVGIGALGFPLANLAIVAGALSLGIGFGLQSIVNNFVSGLILLFERPIKVGDWIVTSAGEGIVKRISVRSTEIETFDWASVIIPNSELITAPVTNWTHKNRYTRLTIPIGVSYNEDPEQAAGILLQTAKANRRALSYPAPEVYFSGFGDSSLDFEVRIFINNVGDRIPVQNELRFAIFAALKDAGIEIPFPQRDLHIKGLVPGTAMTAGARDTGEVDTPDEADEDPEAEPSA